MVSSIAICSTSSRAAAACDLDSSPNPNGARPSSSHSSRGGLSFLFANNRHSEPMEGRRGSDPLSANDVLSGSAKVRDHNSPVSVLQLPGSPHRFSLPAQPLNRREGFGICPTPQSIRTLPSSSPEEALNPAFFQPSTPRKTVGEELAFSSDMGGPLHPETAQKDPAMSLSELFCQPLFPYSMESSQDILHDAQSRHEIFNDPLIIQAFKEADEAHHGQMRANGDPYIVHCVETAMILATVGASKVVVAAGLLHDTIDDSTIDYEEIQDLFGVDVADLVEGVSRLSEFSKLARDNNTASKRVEADRLHTMFLAMADVQVVLIKLADRLHNMRTLDALPHHKQWRMAKETLEVFVPLANRLGIWSWKAGLEDLCFKHLKPKEYQELKRKLSHGFREATLLSSIQKLDEALKGNGVMYYDLCGRPKNLYSIYKKIVRKGTNINEVWDVRGLRLIVASEEDCFTVLKIVHGLWPQDPEQYRDYISKPKLNGYQSLHTVVFAEDGLPLEVQIRSKEMHQQAEFGVAAHWRYKEGDTKHSSFVLQMVEWARWVLTWKNEIMDTKLRLSPLGADLRPPCPFLSHVEGCPHAGIDTNSLLNRHGDEPIYVLVLEDDKMVVQELPEGSTVAELLYRRSDDEYFPAYSSWDEEPRLSVNHRMVSDLNQKLKMGDLVEMKPCISELSLKEYMEKCMLDETKSESTEEQGARNSLARPVMML